jgi:hypothetical protein
MEAIFSSEMMVTCIRLHGFTSKKIVTFMVTAGRTSNLRNQMFTFMLTATHRTGWLSGYCFESFSGGAPFECRSRHRLSWYFLNFYSVPWGQFQHSIYLKYASTVFIQIVQFIIHLSFYHSTLYWQHWKITQLKQDPLSAPYPEPSRTNAVLQFYFNFLGPI